MEVILLGTVANLGKLGECVKVKRGYGRNFLIPQGKAVVANLENKVLFEEKRQALEAVEQEKLQAAQARSQVLQALELVITVATADEDHLFGSVSVRDIVEHIHSLGGEVDVKEVHIIDGPIRKLGDYEVVVQLHTDVVIRLPVQVIAE